MSEIRVEDWTGEAGERWLAHLAALESTIEPIGRALLDHAGLRAGERVVDIGCGAGANTFDIASAVAPGGSVIGIDVAPMLIAKARQRLAETSLANVDFLVADAETATPPGIPFDRLFSRFGLMFFADTGAAFANMRGWLRPGGRLVFACWAAQERNPWIQLVGAVIARHGDMPRRDPDAPGPFRLADVEMTRTLLERAGYEGISDELWEGEEPLGGVGASPAQAADFVLAATSVADPLRDTGADLVRVHAELVDALAPFERDGAIRVGAAAWLITARNPG